MKFAARIKSLRQENNISQAELAEKVGVSQQCVSEWERGKTEPTLGFIVKLADTFDVTTDYITCRIDEK